MRQLRKILEYSVGSGLSLREVAKLTGTSKTTVSEYLARFRRSGITLDEALTKTDEVLLGLFEEEKEQTSEEYKTLVALFPEYALRLKQKGMTRQLLWDEYRSLYPQGYLYTQFCHHYRSWRESLDVCMHQDHDPGDKGFLDYAGTTFPYRDRLTGTVKQAQFFVAVLGASSLTYTEATESQKLRRFYSVDRTGTPVLRWGPPCFGSGQSEKRGHKGKQV